MHGEVRYTFPIYLAVLAIGFACNVETAAAEEANKLGENAVDFARDIRPVLESNCYKCHGPKKQDGGIRWDRKARAMAGGDSGEVAIAPGKPAGSELVRRLTAEDEEKRMPPADAGKPLAAAEIAMITRWIEQGAAWPDSATDTKHWAYVKPVRPALGKVADKNWPRNAIDYFILARLEAEGLAPSVPADPARLIRRVYLDLIGMPPSVEGVDAFLKDPSRLNYEKIVDRLLASKRFGEKWARPWLDLARYSDSNGFQADQIREMWAYRDWVIDALNADMPFDQFTIEQVAGDLLPGALPRQKIATGFHRTPTCNVEAGVDPEENRTNQVIDRVNTTGTVWLGTTLECAQCHNHKYDPFTQKDYYQIFAFFNNTPLEVSNGGKGVQFNFSGPKMDIPLPPEQANRRATWQRQHDALTAELEREIAAVAQRQPAWERAVLAAVKTAEVHPLEIREFKSSGGSSSKILPDRSVRVSGKSPGKDTYTVTIDTQLTDITGFKIEALTDSSLEQKGPGRGDRPNFVLNEVIVTAGPAGDAGTEAKKLSTHSAAAGFSQKNWDVKGAFDGNPKTGWAIAPQFGKPHFATVQLDAAVGFDGGTTFVFTMIQNYGRTRTIGRLRLSALTGGSTGEDMQPAIVAILQIPAGNRDEQARQKVRDYHLAQQPSVRKLRSELAKLKGQMDAIRPPSTLVMVENDRPRLTSIFKRGNFLDKGRSVQPAVPSVLHPLPGNMERNRLGLAKWLVSADNPLVARVTVNRWWEEIFGRGIVRTCEDFGRQGDRPSHPKLLDWLAVELMTGDWSTKRLLKLMVTSAAYQQTAKITSELLERDFENVLVARGPRIRLAAEVIRDNALQISGLLSTKMYGPPIYPPQPAGLWNQTGRNEPKYVVATDENRFRRGIYVVWRRAAPYPSFINFDAPDRMKCVVQRSRTNTPLQALTLMNDEAYVEAAKSLAARIITDRPQAVPRERIEYAGKLCLARKLSGAEASFLESMLRAEMEHFRSSPAAAQSLIGGFKLPQGRETPGDLQRWASWFCVANVLLNLDETITK